MQKSKIKTRTYSKLSEEQKKQWYKERYPAYIWQIAYIYEEVAPKPINMKFDGFYLYFWLTLQYESENDNLTEIETFIQDNINKSKIMDKNCQIFLEHGEGTEFHIKFYWTI